MEEELKNKARNYYLLGLFAENKRMNSEGVSNYFKALFAVCDWVIFRKTERVPKNHTERFDILKKEDSFLYNLLSNMFLTYRETYTKSLSTARVAHVRGKIDEAFKRADVSIPSKEDL